MVGVLVSTPTGIWGSHVAFPRRHQRCAEFGQNVASAAESFSNNPGDRSMSAKILIPFLGLLTICGAAATTRQAYGQQPSVREILKTTLTREGKPVEFPKTNTEVTADIVEFAPGSVRPRTFHPWPRYVYVIEGTLTVGDDAGKDAQYPAGSLLVTQNSWDIPKNLGSAPVKLLVIDTTEAGKSNNIVSEKK
jgi:quercetin dioxygenase-like cupin family protein